jgi:hypothetical protein
VIFVLGQSSRLVTSLPSCGEHRPAQPHDLVVGEYRPAQPHDLVAPRCAQGDGGGSVPGRVALVGTDPGDPNLLMLKAGPSRRQAWCSTITSCPRKSPTWSGRAPSYSTSATRLDTMRMIICSAFEFRFGCCEVFANLRLPIVCLQFVGLSAFDVMQEETHELLLNFAEVGPNVLCGWKTHSVFVLTEVHKCDQLKWKCDQFQYGFSSDNFC